MVQKVRLRRSDGQTDIPTLANRMICTASCIIELYGQLLNAAATAVKMVIKSIIAFTLYSNIA